MFWLTKYLIYIDISNMGRLSIIAKDRVVGYKSSCIYIFSRISNIYLMYKDNMMYFFSRSKYFVTLITVAWHNFALEVELDLPQLLRLVQLQFSQLFCPLLQVLYLFFSFHTFLSFLKPGEQEPWTIKRKLKGRKGWKKSENDFSMFLSLAQPAFLAGHLVLLPRPLLLDLFLLIITQCTADLKLLIIMISQITNSNSSVYWRCHLKFGTAGRHLRYYVRLDSEWCGTFDNGIA